MTDKNRTALQWARPLQFHPILHRSILVAESKTIEPKEFVLFDEIFPAKKDISNGNEIQKNFNTFNDTFHRAIGPVLVIGQCFGVMPVCGILSPDATFLRFSWTSWRLLYSLITIVASAILGAACLMRIFYTGVDIFKTISLMFYGSTFLSLVLFLRLAPQWPMLVQAIAHDEYPRVYPNFKFPRRRTLRVRFAICCFTVLFMALVEHVLSIVAGIAVAVDCLNGKTPAESFFVNSYPQVFYFTPFELWKGPLLQIANLGSTFNWNFMDLFIIVVSLGLTDRFDRLNDRLDAVIGKNLPEDFWRSARQEFAHLSSLVRLVDCYINEIVLLSFANNLYFICLQLFNSLNNGHDEHHSGPGCGRSKDGPMRGFSHVVYFTFSFGFLMARSISVSLFAARVHSSSQKPASVIYAVPSASYCTEVLRFLEQVTTDVVAFTGLNFFYVTRGLILTIAGTVVTYELVLVQFNSPSPSVTANITITDSCGNPLKT